METEKAEIPVEYGNLTGQYFTQWRIDALLDLLQLIVYCYSDTPLVEIAAVKIWYDAEEDFHRMSFYAPVTGHTMAVRLYKVWTCQVDNVVTWQGCPRHMVGEFAKHLRNQMRIETSTTT